MLSRQINVHAWGPLNCNRYNSNSGIGVLFLKIIGRGENVIGIFNYFFNYVILLFNSIFSLQISIKYNMLCISCVYHYIHNMQKLTKVTLK